HFAQSFTGSTIPNSSSSAYATFTPKHSFFTMRPNLTMSQKSITHETCITTKKRLKINNLVSFRDPAGIITINIQRLTYTYNYPII
ncbi:MAG: hypothetical protein KH111_19490, partial [Bacteroidales bacterium]|nr:hypothetical protein [Bacteroidales bacterium]